MLSVLSVRFALLLAFRVTGAMWRLLWSDEGGVVGRAGIVVVVVVVVVLVLVGSIRKSRHIAFQKFSAVSF